MKKNHVTELSKNEQMDTNGGFVGWIMVGIVTGYHMEYYKENGELKWWF